MFVYKVCHFSLFTATTFHLPISPKICDHKQNVYHCIQYMHVSLKSEEMNINYHTYLCISFLLVSMKYLYRYIDLPEHKRMNLSI